MSKLTLAVPLVLSLGILGACSSSDVTPPGAQGGGAGSNAAGAAPADAGEAGDTSEGGAGVGGATAGGASAGGAGGAGGKAGAPSSSAKIGLNDVSYLFPLPKTDAELKSLLTFASTGAHGALFPRTIYDPIITHLTELTDAEESYQRSHVVAMRLDPCAAHLSAKPNEPCESEVRLTTELTDSPGGFSDGGVHLVYRVEAAELSVMLSELLALKPTAFADLTAEPLGPHPIMKKEGLSGPFARGVKDVILKHVGGDRLIKVTTVIAGRSGNDWFFDQYEKQGKAFVATNIPTLNVASTGFDEFAQPNSGGRDTQLHDIDPKGFPLELANSDSAKKLPPAKMKAALERLAALEDPNLYSSLSVECVSCHLTTSARGFYEQLTGTKVAPSYVAPAGLNLTRVDETELSGFNTRAFGYFGGGPALTCWRR
jgi:hypothetical protein